MTLIEKPRSAWTKESIGGDTLNDKKLLGLSVHYPGSGAEFLNNLSEAEVAGRLRGWWKYHTQHRDWSDIGYQMAIDGAGRVWTLRGIKRVPAATASTANPDSNWEWGAVLFIVGDHEAPTPKAVAAFNEWRKTRWLKQWPKATRVVGHGDVEGAQTSCPGLWLRTAIRSGDILDPDREPNEEELEMADLTNATVGRDKDGTATVMGELAARINHIYGEHVDGDKTPSVATRILNKLEAIETRLESVEKKVAK